MDLSIVLDGLPARRGPLGLLSGDEFTPAVAAFDRALLALTGPRVALILDADHSNAAQTARTAIEHFRALGGDAFELDLHDDGPLPPYDVAYLGGGSPDALLRCLRDCARWPAVLARWRDGAGLVGASAGAMALCRHCLTPEPGASVPTVWTHGAGPLASVGLAVHASSRPAEWLEAITRSAPVPVLAIDDRTGLIVHPDGTMVISGEGWVYVRGT